MLYYLASNRLNPTSCHDGCSISIQHQNIVHEYGYVHVTTAVLYLYSIRIMFMNMGMYIMIPIYNVHVYRTILAYQLHHMSLVLIPCTPPGMIVYLHSEWDRHLADYSFFPTLLHSTTSDPFAESLVLLGIP